MDRRTLLKRSLALAAFYGLPAAPLLAATRQMPAIADGEAQRFSFDWLQRLAREMANAPYRNNMRELPETLASLTPQQYNAIGYDAGHSLWHDLDGKLDVQFFHVGMGFNQPVRMYALDPDSHQAREIHFDPDIFRYDGANVDVAQLEGEDTLGFAGFRVFKVPSLTERDIVSFLGASYFRAVDDTYQYGISARGLAVNTFAESEDEEFPTYTRFWLETPAPDSTTFTAYALLDSPKVAGAYRFVIDCQPTRVVMDIEKHLYPREAIEQLGIAPMTSMFSCGTHQRRMCDTIHPQIHDSDRLTMWRGNGEWVCRPLNNPPVLQYNAFADESPKGFGLLQTERDFEAYEDVIGNYHERPSLWIEPRSDWGKGEIQLMEIPTTGETMDNVVAFWKPAAPVEPGDSLTFAYRQYWSALPPVRPDLARIRETRSGMGAFPEGWAPGEHYPEEWARRFAVDYVGGDILNIAKNGPPIMAQLEISGGRTSDIQIFQVEEFEGIRVIFDWYPTDASTDPIDMRMVLEGDGAPLSETWLYQYFPPPPEQREHPPHPLDD
ncbi:glucan biosynthesis protein [Chromohalobacter israelensis]|uniref:glucan biosynthesis protein n=1 Tax=Chromohalobacter israelensis TaxID=141390 RepID=UPI0005564CCA|nr:glucan biosynthesis protein D [Chromohalobacter israelensis]MDF9434153.1 glucan biosynthesis protein D [Chromohalobacter israelensis]